MTKPVCCQCAALLIQAGIKRVVMRTGDAQMAGKWVDNCKEAAWLMLAGIVVDYHWVVGKL